MKIKILIFVIVEVSSSQCVCNLVLKIVYPFSPRLPSFFLLRTPLAHIILLSKHIILLSFTDEQIGLSSRIVPWTL